MIDLKEQLAESERRRTNLAKAIIRLTNRNEKLTQELERQIRHVRRCPTCENSFVPDDTVSESAKLVLESD